MAMTNCMVRERPPRRTHRFSLCVLNLSRRTTGGDLRQLFNSYGKNLEIHSPRGSSLGQSRGVAFVGNMSADGARAAIERLNGRNVDGREITVRYGNCVARGANRGRFIRGTQDPKGGILRPRDQIFDRKRYRKSDTVAQLSLGRWSPSHGSHGSRSDQDKNKDGQRSRSRSRSVKAPSSKIQSVIVKACPIEYHPSGNVVSKHSPRRSIETAKKSFQESFKRKFSLLEATASHIKSELDWMVWRAKSASRSLDS